VTRRLILTYLAITAIVLVLLEIPLALTFKGREESRFLGAVERDARTVSESVEDTLDRGDVAGVQQVPTEYRTRVGGRVVVVDERGQSLVDTDHPGDPPRDFSTRPEFATALQGRISSGIRRSDTLNQRLLYVAVPVLSAGRVRGAVRITYPASELDHRVWANWRNLGLLAVAVLVAVAVVGWFLAKGVTAPVERLRVATDRLAAGDLTARAAPATGPPEVRRLSEDFDEMAERLSELVGAQRAFVADASHQLRTPLTALRLRLEHLDEVVEGDDHAQLDAAIEETYRLQRLVDGLLTLARADTTKPARVTVDVMAVARERCAAWAPLMEERAVRLDCVGEPHASAHAAPGAVEQVLDNLVANAYEASPDGSTVTISVANRDDVLLAVDDEGPGMTDDQMARATDRFWRAPDAAPGGTGLGLAIVQRLAEQSGGQFELARNEHGGVRASVTLEPA
jgi:signal transduction histidine kinase